MTIAVKPLDGPLGAEISGLDVRKITEADSKALLEAFNQYHVLVVHGPTINDDELVEFGKCFGLIEKARKKSPLSHRDDIMVISNIRQDGELVGSLPDGEMSYHFDRIHQAQPCKGAALHGLEIPAEGGDTCFANMVRAYETLPEATKKRIEGLKALNTFTYGATKRDSKTDELGPHAIHPIVRRIPETGKKALYVCRLMTDSIVGMGEQESQELLTELCDHIENTGLIYQHKWKVGDIVVWDNRCTSHARTDFSDKERRLMKRVTIGDTIPPLQ
jgi:taurine dioxygenase